MFPKKNRVLDVRITPSGANLYPLLNALLGTVIISFEKAGYIENRLIFWHSRKRGGKKGV